MAFVPVAQSDAQKAVAQRVADFNAQYRDLLSTTATLIQAVPAAAFGPAGSADFQRYFAGEAGGDSLNVQERVGFGDVELGFKWRALDRRPTPGRVAGIQLAIAGNVRLPTGSRLSPSEIADLSLGSGSVILETRVISDAQIGRFGLMAASDFAMRTDRDTARLKGPDARWVDVMVQPRWQLSKPLAIHGAYAIRYTESTGDQLLGGGVSFSTLSSYAGTGPMPIEMRFTHLEAVKGDAGRPKFFRDQIELRLYFRLH
jgi:hypothetical protein